MYNKKKYDLKERGVTWEDLVPWIDEIYSEFGYRVSFMVYLETSVANLQPTVAIEFYHTLPGGKMELARRDYKSFDIRGQGNLEHEALKIVSHALLEFENERYAAERQQPLWA